MSFSDSILAFARLPIEREARRNLVRREQAHHAQCADSAARVPAQVDNEAVNVAQTRDPTGNLVGDHNSNHAGKHGDFQVACAVFEASRLHEGRFDEMELLPFWTRHIDRHGLLFVFIVDNHDIRLLPHWKNWMFWWYDFTAIDAEQDIPGLNAGNRGGAARVDILKDPSLPIMRVIRQVRCAERCAARCSPGRSVKEAEMRGMQFGQKIAHGLLKGIRGCGGFDDGPMTCPLPLASPIEFFGRVEPFLQSG